jgi:hypothetical protein
MDLPPAAILPYPTILGVDGCRHRHFRLCDRAMEETIYLANPVSNVMLPDIWYLMPSNFAFGGIWNEIQPFETREATGPPCEHKHNAKCPNRQVVPSGGV